MATDIDTHLRRGHPALFLLLMIFSIIEGSIAGFLVARFNKHHNYPNHGVRDKVRYLLFASWWSALGSFLLGVLFVVLGDSNVLASVAVHGIFIVVTWIIWFAGAIAITRGLHGGHNCAGLSYNLPYCNQLNMVMAFAWICWAITSILIVFVVFRGATSLRRGESTRGQTGNP